MGLEPSKKNRPLTTCKLWTVASIAHSNLNLGMYSLFMYFQPAKVSTIESLKRINSLRNKLLQTKVAYPDSSYKTQYLQRSAEYCKNKGLTYVTNSKGHSYMKS